ncbi:MAG: sortase [Patescibacteria group bacterium]|nr:sortase [Patescibacteria group bacterium]
MDYFKPYKYEKNSNLKSQISKPVRVYVAGFLIFLGTSIAYVKVVSPYTRSLFLYSQAKPLFYPVLGYKTGQANFSFEELKKYARAVSPNKNVPEKFFLTIPKLKIYEAEVKTNDTSLAPNKMLGHYAGTALPGESFNSFIYGHAVFEEYFDPLDYKKIFSTLPNLLPGDEFYIKYLNKTYKYVVTMKKTLEPSDVNPYENFYPDIPNNSTVSLMTCVPPGRKDFRLIVVGSLVKQGN